MLMGFSERAFTIICLIKGMWIIQKGRRTLKSAGSEPGQRESSQQDGAGGREGDLVITCIYWLSI